MKLFSRRQKTIPYYAIKPELLFSAFPKSLHADIAEVLSAGLVKVWSEPSAELKAQTNSEEVLIPQRIYAEPFTMRSPSATQQIIYHCIFSRSTDGYVREASVRALTETPVADWVIPYLYLALSDYVIQVANIVAQKGTLAKRLSEFVKCNPEIHRLSVARAISFCDLHKSHGTVYVNYKEYPPYKMLKSLSTN